ncbi:hypothetical protein D3C74_507120 [compost metagenome]
MGMPGRNPRTVHVYELLAVIEQIKHTGSPVIVPAFEDNILRAHRMQKLCRCFTIRKPRDGHAR